MKRIIIFCFLLYSTALGLHAIGLKPADKQACDSVFKIVSRMPLDTTRIIYLQSVYQSHKNADWTIRLLHGALSLSRKFENQDLELSVLSDIYSYYGFRDDLKTITTYCLPQLKAACCKHKKYKLYFSSWSDLLNQESEFGNIATVEIQAEKMRKEADSLNYPEGTLVADLAIAGGVLKGNRHEESIQLHLKILKSSLLTHSQKRMIYQRLSSANQQLGNLNKALEYLDKCLQEQKQVKDISRETLRRQTISIEFGFCFLLQQIPDSKKLKEHLDVLKQYYDDHLTVRNKVSYHSYWGSYYYLTLNREKSYEEYNRAMEIGKELRNTFMISVPEMKAQSATYFKDYDVAAEAYKKAAQLCYSINLDIARKNKEAVQANFRIRKALLDQENNTHQFNSLKIGVAVLLLTVLFVVLCHIIRTNRLLHRSAKEVREALKLVDAANRMKETFLRNINEEIKAPIDIVIKCSTLLSAANNLSQEDRTKYSNEIKAHAGQLIELVNNVLDLSRLEAGMTKFNVQENDLVSLCADTRIILQMQETNQWKQTFSTSIETLKVQVDSSWFCKAMGYLLSSPEICHEEFEVSYVLTTEDDFAHILIIVPPIKLQTFNSNERIRLDIARLYFETVGGSCVIDKETISITYPLLYNQQDH